jgi:hypothetical protein
MESTPTLFISSGNKPHPHRSIETSSSSTNSLLMALNCRDSCPRVKAADPEQYMAMVTSSQIVPPHDPVSLVADMHHVDAKLTLPPIPPSYRPSRELLQWFLHIRQQLVCCPRDREPGTDFTTTVRSIKSREMPMTQSRSSATSSTRPHYRAASGDAA